MKVLPVASSIDEILPGVIRWEVFSPKHRVLLTSHAHLKTGVLTIFDPIELILPEQNSLLNQVEAIQIMLTSENHYRATDIWKEQTNAQIHSMASSGFEAGQVVGIPVGTEEWMGYEVCELAGGPAGETVFVDRDTNYGFGGDAVVNLPDRKLEVLPEQYCSNREKLLRSVDQLHDLNFLFPAHGRPVGPHAGALIRELNREN